MFLIFPFFPTVVCDQQTRRLTYSDNDVCTVKGSTLTISSSYRLPSGDKIKSVFWFIKLYDNQYQNLASVPQFSGRVMDGCSGQTCTLTIRDLTESDSGELCFGFTSTNDPLVYRGDPGVSLIVTGRMFTALSFTSSMVTNEVYFSRSSNQRDEQ